MTDYEKLMTTASQCGIKIITDDFCCKVLAWLYMFGAETEMVVYNVALKTDIQEAQKRLNVLGGEVPNNGLCKKMREDRKDCGEDFRPRRPKWVDEIGSKYGIATKER